MKSKNIMLSFMVIALAVSIAPLGGIAAGETLTCARSEARIFSSVKFDGKGLTASTYYTLYKGTTLLKNQSTEAGSTTISFSIKFGINDVGSAVQIDMKNSSGGDILGTVYIDILEIIDENTAGLLAYVLSDILPIVFVLTVVLGLPGMVITAIGLKKSGKW